MAKLLPFLVTAALGVLLAGLEAALDLSGEVVYLTGALLGALVVAISAPLALGEARPSARDSVSARSRRAA